MKSKVSEVKITKQHFREYWDEWHKKWYSEFTTEKVNEPIKIIDWSVPKTKKGKVILGGGSVSMKTQLYFPEPYYCRNIDKDIHAIFLSINPGSGGEEQLVEKKKHTKLYKAYLKNKKSYNLTLEYLLGHLGEKSTGLQKFFCHREEFARDLLVGENNDQEINILNADLVPWHTANQSDIASYIDREALNVKEFILKPIMNIAQNMPSALKNKILVRGVSFRNLFDKLFDASEIKDIQYYAIAESEKAESKTTSVILKPYSKFLTIVILRNEVQFFIFTGGQGMNFPSLEKIAYPIDNNTLRQDKIGNLILNAIK